MKTGGVEGYLSCPRCKEVLGSFHYKDPPEFVITKENIKKKQLNLAELLPANRSTKPIEKSPSLDFALHLPFL
jgi:hypothetical protein